MTTPLDQASAVLRQAAALGAFDPQRDPLIVAVSGGPDSLALLHILSEILPPERLIIAHLDHGLRPSSAAEAAAVAEMAAGLRFHMERVDVAALARDNRLSLEEAGRAARYAFFGRVARAAGAPAVATGHHADDQVETVLMHFLRGSGTAGLRGMRPISPSPSDPGMWLIRPLLHLSQADIEAYCVEHGLRPIHDESNADPSFFRNRLRHELLPLLESYNPQIRLRLRETAEVIAGDEALLAELTEQAWQAIASGGDGVVVLDRAGWAALPLALRRRLLRRAAAELAPGLRDLSFRALEAARELAETGDGGAKAALPAGLALLVNYDELVLSRATADLTREHPQTLDDSPVGLPVPGAAELANGWRIEASPASPIALDEIRELSDPWMVFVALEPDAILSVRPRRPGDRMEPFGLGGTASLKKIMIDRKIPAHLRPRWPLVVAGDAIIWLPGHLLDERARVTADDRLIFRLHCIAPG